MRITRAQRFIASIALAAGLASTFAPASLAQVNSQPPQPPAGGETVVADDAGNEWRFTFGGGYTYRFDTSLDEGGGDFSNSALTGGLNASTDINRDLSLTLRVNFGVSDYSFSNGSGGINDFAALEPWNTIHAIAFGGAASWTVTDQWSLFGGPIFQFARESDADWADSFTAGVIAGATYAVHDQLVIGLGVGIISQIEDSIRFFPIPIIEWGINDNFRISSRGASGGRTSIEFSGVEMIWMTDSKQWEFALGGGVSSLRFRLDDDGVAPNGVGSDESTPIWLRAGFRPTKNIMIEALAGIGFGGELSLDDENGDSVADSDYDSPLFVGLFGSIKF